MSDELIIIDTDEGIAELRAYLKDKELVAYDSETTGLHKGAEVIGFSVCAEDNKAFYVVIAKWNTELGKLEYIYTNLDTPKTIIQDLTTKQLIMHNSVFDCAKAEDYFKIRLIDALHTDTMILAHLLDENRPVGLKPLAAQYFGDNSSNEAAEMKESVIANGGIWGAKNKEMYKADTYLMGKYGAKDALLTYRLFLQLVLELFEQGLDKFFYEDESMPLLKTVTYDLNTTGLKVDVERLNALQKTLEAECAEAKSFIYSEIEPYIKAKYPGTNKKNVFNIGASQQLSWLLFGQLQLEFGTLTDGGKTVCRAMGLKLPYTPAAKRDFISACLHAKDSIHAPEGLVNGKKVRAKKVKDPWAYIACDKKMLAKLAHRYKWIGRLLEYQSKQKILSTYIKGIKERVQYGIIHPSFLQHGTTSGRFSSRNPNFQNLPRNEKRIKECIIARPGKVFVGADQSQLEPRVFAYYSNDARLLEAFKGDNDFYSVIGMEVFGLYDCTPSKFDLPDSFKIKYKKIRDLTKVFALASVYGATANQLAPTTGKSIDETQNDIDTYFERFAGVKLYMEQYREKAKAEGRVENLFGRPRRMPEAKTIAKQYGNTDHSDLPYEARNVLNLAVNHPIQSTGASIMNRAAVAFYNNAKQAGIDCKIVCQVHDSLVIECIEADAENVALLLQDAMENTIDLKTIQLEAVPKIGKNLSEV